MLQPRAGPQERRLERHVRILREAGGCVREALGVAGLRRLSNRPMAHEQQEPAEGLELRHLELERVGDYAESMARQILVLSEIDVEIPIGRFAEISGKAIPMFRAAVEAFVAQDPNLAKQAMEAEDAVDRLRHAVSSELVQLRQDNKIPLEALPPLMHIVNRL